MTDVTLSEDPVGEQYSCRAAVSFVKLLVQNIFLNLNKYLQNL